MAFITKEALIGTKDGVNKVFTSSKNIFQVDDLFWGGAIYTTFSFIGNTVTMLDAPNLGDQLVMDYFDTPPTGLIGGITVQEGIDRITLQKKRTIGEVTNDLWFRFFDALNFKVYESLVMLEPNKYIASKTYNVLAGIESYADPSDLKWIRQFDTGFFDTDINSKRVYPMLRETRIDSTEYGYVRRGTQVFFTPVPTADRTVILDYIPSIANISALTDVLSINTENLDLVLHFLMMKYGDWNLDVATQIANDQMFARDLAIMLQNVAVEPQIFIL